MQGAQYSAFAPDTQFCSQLFRSSSWLFDLCRAFGSGLPQVPTHSFIFSPLLFLCILLLRGEMCTDTNIAALQQKDPRSQPVSKGQERRTKSGPQPRPGETHMERGCAVGCKPRRGCETLSLQEAQRCAWFSLLSRAPV